jgi:hypothetical protein
VRYQTEGSRYLSQSLQQQEAKMNWVTILLVVLLVVIIVVLV